MVEQSERTDAAAGDAEPCTACGTWTADLYRVCPVSNRRLTQTRYCPGCFEQLHRQAVREAARDHGTGGQAWRKGIHRSKATWPRPN